LRKYASYYAEAARRLEAAGVKNAMSFDQVHFMSKKAISKKGHRHCYIKT